LAKVAVVGGGAAGLGAAIALVKAGMDVSLFEADARLGGQCFGAPVPQWDRRTVSVDGGVAEINPAASPALMTLIDELDLRVEPVNTDIAFVTADNAPIWFTRIGQPLFRKPPGDSKALLDEIARFESTCAEVLDGPAYAGLTARRYLDGKQYSADFRTHYFEPRARATLAMPDIAPDDMPIRDLVTSWRMHGSVGGAQRVTIREGMHTLFDVTARWLKSHRAALQLSTRVASVSRLGDSVRLRTVGVDKVSAFHAFDHVVIATSARDAVALLEDATPGEARIFADLPSRRVRQVVHLDPKLLPADRATWGAYNYVAHEASTPTHTIYVTRHHNLPPSMPDVFVTTNPAREPDADKVLADRTFDHPVLSAGAEDALHKLDVMQGRRRTWFCGGYQRAPFAPEQAYRGGLEIAERLVTAVADATRQFEAGVDVSEGGFDEFLRDVPLFAGLDARALAELQLAARPFKADVGTMLFRQGDAPDGFYLIKRGDVDILRRVPGDQVVKIATLGPRAVLGEMSLLDGHPRSTHATAAAPTFGYFVSAEQFQLLRADYRPAASAVMDCFRREVATRARRVIAQISATAVVADPKPGAPVVAANWPEPVSAKIDPAILHSLPFFRNFRSAELEEFIAPLRRYDFGRGHTVYAAGEAARNCLVIVRGALSLHFASPRGISNCALLGPGNLAGSLALVDGGPQPLACVAREATIAFEIDRVDFDAMRRGGSIVAHKFMEAVTAGTVGALRKVSAHMARIAPERQPASPTAEDT
jgi:predicted NAD/FAD-binding protein/CRP-like cAMP-binding protein